MSYWIRWENTRFPSGIKELRIPASSSYYSGLVGHMVRIQDVDLQSIWTTLVNLGPLSGTQGLKRVVFDELLGIKECERLLCMI